MSVQDAALEMLRADERRVVDRVALYDVQTLQAQKAAEPARIWAGPAWPDGSTVHVF